MKVLTVYSEKGYTKFRGIYQTYVYELKEGLLYIYKLDPVSNSEKLWAVYRDWTHLELEDDQG